MTEAELQKRVTDLCGWLGLRVWHDNDSRRNAAGWPDLVIVGRGVVYAELKALGGRLRPEQQEWLSALRNAGAEVHVWRPSDWPVIEKRLRALARPRLIKGEKS